MSDGPYKPWLPEPKPVNLAEVYGRLNVTGTCLYLWVWRAVRNRCPLRGDLVGPLLRWSEEAADRIVFAIGVSAEVPAGSGKEWWYEVVVELSNNYTDTELNQKGEQVASQLVTAINSNPPVV